MPLNLLKKYNALLELNGLTEQQRRTSLWGVFSRDFINQNTVYFNTKKIVPTPLDGKVTMETLFNHLTTRLIDKDNRSREFDIDRANRLHWVRFHLLCSNPEVLLIFSVNEPHGIRTYIYDKEQYYVIVLEPLRKKDEYYLLTAYKLTGKDLKRNKILAKYNNRRLPELL